MSLNYKTKRKF